MSSWRKVNDGWLWEESGKPPAPVHPVVWVIDDKTLVSGMYALVYRFSLADKYS